MASRIMASTLVRSPDASPPHPGANRHAITQKKSSSLGVNMFLLRRGARQKREGSADKLFGFLFKGRLGDTLDKAFGKLSEHFDAGIAALGDALVEDFFSVFPNNAACRALH